MARRGIAFGTDLAPLLADERPPSQPDFTPGTFVTGRAGRRETDWTAVEVAVAEANDWNRRIISEFRANEGRVGGPFEGAPIVLIHHRGRKSGREYVTPLMYLPAEGNAGEIYIFASKAGAPSNPDWYYNLSSAGAATVERGTDRYQVTVREIIGDERDRIYGEHAQRYPGFQEYAERTRGIRTIPVLALSRVGA